jgi:hypothetical protein
MEKLYFIRCLSEKGKLKTPCYNDGSPVKPWRTFKTEKEAVEFIREYRLDNVLIFAKFVQYKENIYGVD